MSDLETPTPADPSGLGPEVRQSLMGRYDLAQKAGGLLAPVLTAVLAFFVGGLVVLRDDWQEPAHDLPGHLRRCRLQLVLPLGHRRRERRPRPRTCSRR